VDTALRMRYGAEILDPARIDILTSSIPHLEMVVQEVQGEARDYFSELLWLATTVLDRCRRQA